MVGLRLEVLLSSGFPSVHDRREDGPRAVPVPDRRNGRPTTNVIKRTTPVQTQNTSFSYLGQMVTYEIGNMKTVGNMPLYGEDSSSTTAGPIIVDTLPKLLPPVQPGVRHRG